MIDMPYHLTKACVYMIVNAQVGHSFSTAKAEIIAFALLRVLSTISFTKNESISHIDLTNVLETDLM